MQDNILSKVNSPEDLKKIDKQELIPLCQDIRDFLIENVSKNGGHLSSNLGTVELSVALHRVFESPKDQIVWDVGHQAYTHKILTGRKDRIKTLRQKDGISGFPNPKESEYDSFIAGHSSTSLSAAFGMARAKTIKGDDGYVIAVIGDGAASGGMFFEGLNNIGRYHDKLIVILNDNKISISKNIGGIAKYLSEIRVRPKYFKSKDKIDRFITGIPFIGKWLKHKIIRSKAMLKYALYHTTWFEEFGFSFLGPVDGNDVNSVIEVLERAKTLNRPVFIHAETTKGKGYLPAEENPGGYHAVKPFELDAEYKNKTSDGYSAKFGEIMVNIGKEDSRICAISPAMKYASGLDMFALNFPRRFLDVGIAEPLAITCACGISKNGLIPIVAIYSTFLQRAYDQVLHDAAICNQHIILAIDRAGIVGEDGETHQGIFDVAYLSTIPNVKIYSPYSFDELENCIKNAIYKDEGVVAVRYPKGAPKDIEDKYQANSLTYSLFEQNQKNNLIITYGRVFAECTFALKEFDMKVDILKLTELKINNDILNIVSNYKNVIFVEESSQRGSLSENLGYKLIKLGFDGKYIAHTLGNRFIPHQTVAEAFKEYEMDKDGILNILKEFFK